MLIDQTQVDNWLAKYKPVANHLHSDTGWIINEVAIMFETYDDDLEFVKQQPDNNVWTWIDGDEGTVIIAGMAFVNRIGYFVTEVPWTDISETIEVDLYDDDDEDEDESDEGESE